MDSDNYLDRRDKEPRRSLVFVPRRSLGIGGGGGSESDLLGDFRAHERAADDAVRAGWGCTRDLAEIFGTKGGDGRNPRPHLPPPPRASFGRRDGARYFGLISFSSADNPRPGRFVTRGPEVYAHGELRHENQEEGVRQRGRQRGGGGGGRTAGDGKRVFGPTRLGRYLNEEEHSRHPRGFCRKSPDSGEVRERIRFIVRRII